MPVRPHMLQAAQATVHRLADLYDTIAAAADGCDAVCSSLAVLLLVCPSDVAAFVAQQFEGGYMFQTTHMIDRWPADRCQ